MRGSAHTRRFLWLIALLLGIALVDQLIKRWIVALIGPAADRHRIELLGDVVAIEYVRNSGAAFGLFQGATPLFAVVALVTIGVGMLVVWRVAEADLPLAIGISVILGGALGNVIDRVARSYVIDFVALGPFWRFNLADSCISLGAIFVLWLLWRADKQDQVS